MSVTPVKKASARLSLVLYEGYQKYKGYASLPECYQPVNDASREVVSAMQETYGEAWLGLVNPIKDRDLLVKWDGELVCNFQADFVLPKYDGELCALITSRVLEFPKTLEQIKIINNRIRALNGEVLVWT